MAPPLRLDPQMPRPTPPGEILPCRCGHPLAPHELLCVDCEEGYTPLAQEQQRRMLQYAIRYGIEPLTLTQLEAAQAAAIQAMVVLPHTLTPDQEAHLRRMTALNRRMGQAIAGKRRQLAQLARLLAQDQEPQGEAQDPQGDALTDDERTLRLLRAALTQLMSQGGTEGGGGQRVRPMQPGPRPQPPQGMQQQPPQAKDTVQF